MKAAFSVRKQTSIFGAVFVAIWLCFASPAPLDAQERLEAPFIEPAPDQSGPPLPAGWQQAEQDQAWPLTFGKVFWTALFFLAALFIIKFLTAFSGRYSCHHISTVFHHLACMESSLPTSNSLNHQSCTFID